MRPGRVRTVDLLIFFVALAIVVALVLWAIL
jgi:hypothetical protein